METLEITILNPQVKKLLNNLANLNLIKVEKAKSPKKKERRFGSMKGLVLQIADDFNSPLEDFKEYM